MLGKQIDESQFKQILELTKLDFEDIFGEVPLVKQFPRQQFMLDLLNHALVQPESSEDSKIKPNILTNIISFAQNEMKTITKTPFYDWICKNCLEKV